MAFEFKLPDIGEGVVEGEIVEWLVSEGDSVAEDQPLVAVMTDKATVEIPSPKAGRVLKLGAAAGDTVPVGSVLVTIDAGGAESAEAAEGEAAPETASEPKAADEPASKDPRKEEARRLAREAIAAAAAP